MRMKWKCEKKTQRRITTQIKCICIKNIHFDRYIQVNQQPTYTKIKANANESNEEAKKNWFAVRRRKPR